ncbi:hypothetical protein Tco_1238032 [Tanacetum coccineum]
MRILGSLERKVILASLLGINLLHILIEFTTEGQRRSWRRLMSHLISFLAMDFEQHNSKLELQGMTSGHISLGLDHTYAPSTTTSRKPMYDDYMGSQQSYATRSAPAAPATLNLQTLNASTTTDVDELQQQQHFQQQNAQPPLQSEAVADNAHDAMFDENMFINPFAPPSKSSA